MGRQPDRAIGEIGLPIMQLHNNPVENGEYLIGAVGGGDGFAPRVDFGNAEGMLPEDVGADVVFGADHEDG